MFGSPMAEFVLTTKYGWYDVPSVNEDKVKSTSLAKSFHESYFSIFDSGGGVGEGAPVAGGYEVGFNVNAISCT
jgi:hypothetical protein